MSVARETMLARIGEANRGRAASGGPAGVDAEYAALPRLYRLAHHEPPEDDIVALFAERASDYRATVERVPEGQLAGAVARALQRRTADVTAGGEPDGRTGQAHAAAPRYVVPPDLPDAWLAESGRSTIAPDRPALPVADLDAAAGVVTGCAAAIAETGTIVLDHGPGQGRRVLSLVPDFHLVVIRAEQIEPDLAAALERLHPRRPHTFISGPSATSDIELIRVEGVHGPRNLHIVIAA